MGKTVLVTDVDTPLGYSLFKKFLDDGNKVAGTVSSTKKNIQAADFYRETAMVLEWHRISQIESRNLLLSIIKKFKTLDEAIIIQPGQLPCPDKTDAETDAAAQSRLLHETGIPVIEKEIDCRIKGFLYISREIIRNFISRKSGFLLFINNFNHIDNASALSGLTVNGISGLQKKLMRDYSTSGFSVNTIESDSAPDEEFVLFIYRSITEKLKDSTGKYLHFAPQKDFLSGIRKMIKGRS